MRGKRSSLSVLILILLLIAAFGCGRTADLYRYSLDDEELLPFAAMYEVDREQLCLTEIDPDSRVRIERSFSTGGGYDVTLYLLSDQMHRAIFFAWEGGKYVWMGERETHYSGRMFTTPDGEMPEYIMVGYNERESYDIGPLGLTISYIGEDESIPPWPLLTCEQALSIIRSWDTGRTMPEDG